MGGCRCSYRDCKVKSDGKTHLFHYPVFERARCQKWLKNANKLDLLELTLGQLKNRVVCQHHFVDSMFMNTKKNKLKFEAVPTENGPYCVGENSHNSEINFEPETYDLVDSENLLIDDKKTHYLQKYSDFLTKDQTRPDNVTLNNDDKKVFELTILGLDSNNVQPNYIVDLDKNVAELELFNSTSNKQIYDNNQQIATEEKGTKSLVQILPVDFEIKSKAESKSITSQSPDKIQNAPRRTKRIRILENKEVDFNFFIPSLKTEDVKLSNCINGQLIEDVKQSQFVTDFPIAHVNPSQSVSDLQITDVKPSQPVANQQITEDVKQTVTTTQDTEHDKPIKRITRAIKSAQQLVNNGNIESRLQKLENKLMSALNRNTQELAEVKKLVENNGNNNKKASSCKIPFGTQTKYSEEQEKRYHYNQLSRFLSTETKSVLYEALFLSKYDIETNTPKPKRRKCIL